MGPGWNPESKIHLGDQNINGKERNGSLHLLTLDWDGIYGQNDTCSINWKNRNA